MRDYHATRQLVPIFPSLEHQLRQAIADLRPRIHEVGLRLDDLDAEGASREGSAQSPQPRRRSMVRSRRINRPMRPATGRWTGPTPTRVTSSPVKRTLPPSLCWTGAWRYWGIWCHCSRSLGRRPCRSRSVISSGRSPSGLRCQRCEESRDSPAQPPALRSRR
jgi:hypothetical protein